MKLTVNATQGPEGKLKYVRITITEVPEVEATTLSEAFAAFKKVIKAHHQSLITNH